MAGLNWRPARTQASVRLLSRHATMTSTCSKGPFLGDHRSRGNQADAARVNNVGKGFGGRVDDGRVVARNVGPVGNGEPRLYAGVRTELKPVKASQPLIPRIGSPAGEKTDELVAAIPGDEEAGHVIRIVRIVNRKVAVPPRLTIGSSEPFPPLSRYAEVVATNCDPAPPERHTAPHEASGRLRLRAYGRFTPLGCRRTHPWIQDRGRACVPRILRGIPTLPSASCSCGQPGPSA